MDNVLTIEQLFTKRLFRVPSYQRGYAWERRQLQEFVEDVELLPRDKFHYTGTIVLYQDPALNSEPWLDEDGNEYVAYAVVDGQQRLTTIVLFLDAVRRAMDGRAALGALARGLRKNYIATTRNVDQLLYRLELNRDCKDYFEAEALGDRRGTVERTIQAHHRLEFAREFFATYLSEQSEQRGDQFDAWVQVLRDKVVHRLKVSWVTVEDESEVGVIFEVLNNRGKQLSDLEKVKNYLLYLASKLEVAAGLLSTEVNRVWADVFEELMRANVASTADEDQLLRAHWLLAYDPTPRNWRGSFSVKSRFGLRQFEERHAEFLQGLLAYTRALGPASVGLADARQPARTNSFARFSGEPRLQLEVQRVSEKLRRVNAVASFLPLLMAYRLRVPDDARSYLEVVRLCEVYAFRVFRLLVRRSNTGQPALFRLAFRFFTGEITHAQILQKLRKLVLRYCPDDIFIARFQLREHENNWYQWRGLKYFLYEYEEHLARGERVQLPWDVVEGADLEQTIEHVLPQTPEDAYWTERFNEALRRRYTHDLGNLSLTSPSHNSSYGRKPFREKKGRPGASQPCYANSNLFMERGLCLWDGWNEAAVLQRRQEMVAWALQRWAVHGSAGAGPGREGAEGVGSEDESD